MGNFAENKIYYMDYYRLEINPKEINTVLDTNVRNNIQRCPYQKDFSEVLKTIMTVSYQTKLSLNETYALTESIVYDSKEWDIAIKSDQCIWNNNKINSLFVMLINQVLCCHYEDCERGICSVAFDLNNEVHKSYIWNYIYEYTRLQIIQNSPQHAVNVGRYNSAYFFNAIEDCENFRSYNGMTQGIVCKVDILEEYDSFRGDMNILENLPPFTSTANDVLLAAIDYWMEKATNTPIYETLFHGKYKLIPLT
jgi:hypothetical protein